MSENQSSSKSNSPHDSLSPLDEHRPDKSKDQELITDIDSLPLDRINSNDARANFNEVQTKQQPHFTCQESRTEHEVAAANESIETFTASTPHDSLIIRNYRPHDLSLTRTNGLTTVTLDELRHAIRDAGVAYDVTTTQLARPRPSHFPKTPATPSPLFMGNKPSSIAGSPAPDNASLRSVVRNPARNLLRKSSTNLFKHFDSKTNLPRDLTATVFQVQQQVSPVSFDGGHDASEDVDEDAFLHTNQRADETPNVVQPHSASTVTITNENAFPPLSPSTIRELRFDSFNDTRAEHRSPCADGKGDISKHALLRHSALSPSIPAPSPLPEDSPHKYGLKDRTDTPETLEPEELSVVKARRRSSGLDIFNEAKSLQSASSFLNGLSTSRRRAESAGRSVDVNGWRKSSYDTARPYTSGGLSRPASRPTIQNTYSSERCRGHNYKPSGFAYSRPLSVNQIKCYRNHQRLVSSRNKKAPVECAVCHMDDDRDHYSCSWCALRMCKFCRKDFAERGMAALKERIKQAELGNPSPSSSSDDLGGVSRGRKSYT